MLQSKPCHIHAGQKGQVCTLEDVIHDCIYRQDRMVSQHPTITNVPFFVEVEMKKE